MKFKPLEMDKKGRDYGSSLPPLELIDSMFRGLSGENVPDEKYHETDVYMGCATVAKWYQERRPYYRIYPGVLETILKLNMDKVLQMNNMEFPFGLNTLEIEFPEICWDIWGFHACVVRALDDTYYGVTVAYMDDGYGFFPLNRKTFKNNRDKEDPRVRLLGRILFGILAIGDDPEIVKPIILQADKRKYEETKDPKYIDKARRRGVIGFDLGPDIPTQEEVQKMIAENELAEQQGRKRPHKRCAYLGWRWVGHKGAQKLKLTWIKEAFINKDLLTAIPQGFRDKPSSHFSDV